VSPAQTGTLLVNCFAQQSASATHTTVTGMTEAWDAQEGSEISFAADYLVLTSAGATGTKASTASVAAAYDSMSLAINPADTTAPTVPSGVTATANSATQVTVAWTASTDAVGVTSYRVRQGGVDVTGHTADAGSPAVITGLSPSTAYSFTVSAVDASGNRSAESTAATVTTPAAPDTTAPTVPSSVTATANSATQVTVAWTASTDAVGVVSYRVRRGGVDVTGHTADAGSPAVITGLSPSTAYSFTVSAVDAAGNRSAESTAATVTTPAAPDTTAPTVPAGVTATTNSSTQITVAWSASTDAVGVASYRLRKGGVDVTGATALTGTSFAVTGLTPSTLYSFTVSAVDAAGNRSAESTAATATTSAPPDTTAPTVPTGVTATADSSSQVTVSWTASTDAVGVTSYRLRQGGVDVTGATAVAGTSFAVTGLSPSTLYSFTVSAVDAAGNRSAESSAATATTPAAVARTFYVSPTGSDAADGLTPATAWATVSKVNATTLSWTDTVLFARGGTWNTVLTVAAPGVSIGAYGVGALPVFNGAGLSACIRATGNSVAVRDVVVSGASVLTGSGTGGSGLYFTGTDGLAERVEATASYVGITFYDGAHRGRALNCNVHDNTLLYVGPGTTDDAYSNGFGIWAADAVEIANCIITGHHATSPDFGTDGSAVELYGATNAVVHHNVASDNNTFAELGRAGTANNNFYDNLVTAFRANASALTIQGTGGEGPATGTKWTNNTVSLTGTGALGFFVGPGTDLQLANNVWIAATLGEGEAGATITESHSVYVGTWSTGAGLPALGATSILVADLASVEFVNAAGGDYHLTLASPAVDRGAAVTFLTDLDGKPRTVGAAPDAGAYEYAPTVSPPAPTPAPVPPADRPARRLEVSVYQGSYDRVGRVPDYVSCSVTWNWLAVGVGELVVGEDDPIASNLLMADQVVIGVVVDLGSTRWSGRVDTVKLERDGPPGSGVVTAILVDDWIWLQRMLASQNGANTSLASMPQYDTRTGPAVSVAADFINAAAARLGVPVVASKPAVDTSPTVTLKARMTSLADLLTDTLKSAGVTLTAQIWLPSDPQPPDLSVTLTTPTVVFRPQVLADKPWLQWTDTMTNIQRVGFQGKQPLAYRTILGLSGTDAARVYDQVVNLTRQTGVGPFGLPEIYTDATEAALGGQSAAAGITALNDTGGTVSVTFEVDDADPFRFGEDEDFVVGDLATAVIGGASWRQRISKLTAEDTRQAGLVITPVIGEQSDLSGDDMMVQALARVAESVRALQAGR
jgi:chitodextrinase